MLYALYILDDHVVFFMEVATDFKHMHWVAEQSDEDSTPVNFDDIKETYTDEFVKIFQHRMAFYAKKSTN